MKGTSKPVTNHVAGVKHAITGDNIWCEFLIGQYTKSNSTTLD